MPRAADGRGTGVTGTRTPGALACGSRLKRSRDRRARQAFLAGAIFALGEQVHCAAGLPHPEQVLFLISRPHVLHGVHPQTWHIAVSFPRS